MERTFGLVFYKVQVPKGLLNMIVLEEVRELSELKARTYLVSARFRSMKASGLHWRHPCSPVLTKGNSKTDLIAQFSSMDVPHTFLSGKVLSLFFYFINGVRAGLETRSVLLVKIKAFSTTNALERVIRSSVSLTVWSERINSPNLLQDTLWPAHKVVLLHIIESFFFTKRTLKMSLDVNRGLITEFKSSFHRQNTLLIIIQIISRITILTNSKNLVIAIGTGRDLFTTTFRYKIIPIKTFLTFIKSWVELTSLYWNDRFTSSTLRKLDSSCHTLWALAHLCPAVLITVGNFVLSLARPFAQIILILAGLAHILRSLVDLAIQNSPNLASLPTQVVPCSASHTLMRWRLLCAWLIHWTVFYLA